MNAFLKNNQGNFLVGIVTSAGKVDVGLLVCLKECCLSPGPGVGVGCGVSQVYLRPGTALPNVGDRIACFGRLVNASEIGALMRGATWKPESDMYLTDIEMNHDDYKEGAIWKPESNPHQIENEVFQVDDNEHIQFEIRQDSEMVLTHLQAATGILAGLSYAMCDDEMLVKSLEGLRQISKDSSLWPKDFIGTEYEADACEKALAYFYYSLAEIAQVADRRIAERRSPGQILDAALIICVRNRIEAALVTLAEMKEARILSGESLFPY